MKRLTAAAIAVAIMLALTVSVFAVTTVAVTINGKTLDYVYPDGTRASAFADGGVTYLPLRAIAEALGFSVTWNEKTNTAEVGTSRLDMLESALTEDNYIPSDAVNEYLYALYTKNGAYAYAVSSEKLRQSSFSDLAASDWTVMSGIDMVDYTFNSKVESDQTDFSVGVCTKSGSEYVFRTLSVTTVEENGSWLVDSAEWSDVMCSAKYANGVMTVSLSENPTTGYAWSFTPPSGFKVTSDKYTPDASEAGMTGVGGTRVFTLSYDGSAKSGAEPSLAFTYERSWSPSADDTICTIHCSVGSDTGLAISYISEDARQSAR